MADATGVRAPIQDTEAAGPYARSGAGSDGEERAARIPRLPEALPPAAGAKPDVPEGSVGTEARGGASSVGLKEDAGLETEWPGAASQHRRRRSSVRITSAIRKSLRRASIGQESSINLPHMSEGRKSLSPVLNNREGKRRSMSEEREEEFLGRWENIHMLERFVPDIVMEHIIQSTHEVASKREAEVRSTSASLSSASATGSGQNNKDEPTQRLYEQDAVVVLADISGFTKLAEQLAKDNTRGEGQGTETLSQKLNSYFGRMIDMIYEGGGDVVKFAGDALLVVWREQSEDPMPSSNGTPARGAGRRRRRNSERRPSVTLNSGDSSGGLHSWLASIDLDSEEGHPRPKTSSRSRRKSLGVALPGANLPRRHRRHSSSHSNQRRKRQWTRKGGVDNHHGEQESRNRNADENGSYAGKVTFTSNVPTGSGSGSTERMETLEAPILTKSQSRTIRRSSSKRLEKSSSSRRKLKRRESWRTTMTNWRKQNVRGRGSVADRLEARRRSIVDSNNSTPVSTPGSDSGLFFFTGRGHEMSDSQSLARSSNQSSSSFRVRASSSDGSNSSDSIHDGEVIELYKDSYPFSSDHSGSESEGGSSRSLFSHRSKGLSASSARQAESRSPSSRKNTPRGQPLARIDDDIEEKTEAFSAQVRTKSTAPFISESVRKFMATLRKKVLSGKITGKEYVEMVYRHLEMRALGFLEEEPSSEEMAAPAAAASGPSRESRLKAIAKGMARNIIVKDRKHFLRTYKRCFLGHEAVLWISRSEAISLKDAVMLGQLMMSCGLIKHATGRKSFRNDNSFYQFTDAGLQKPSSTTEIPRSGTGRVFSTESLSIDTALRQPYSNVRLQKVISKMSPHHIPKGMSSSGAPKKSRLEHLKSICHNCVDACIRMVNVLDNFEGLRLHVGIGAGNVLFMHVGGVCKRLEFIVAGEALVQMSRAEAQSNAGDVCVSENVWEMVKEVSSGHPTLESFASLENSEDAVGTNSPPRSDLVYLVVSSEKCERSRPSMRRWLQWGSACHPDISAAAARSGKPRLRPQLFGQQIMLYVPGPVRNKLAHLHSGSQFSNAAYLADDARRSAKDEVDQKKLFEFRRASILFVNLPGIDYSASAKSILVTLQHALVSMQEILVDLEGSLRQFIMDDKGTTLIGVFGLYPAHENDPHLATQCAMEMVKRLSMLEMTPKIGVTTGTVFAAEVGNERRCEFAVIGDVVNLSARLMVASAKLSKQTSTDINILCCSNTWKVAKTHVQFLTHKPIRVKGKSSLIDIYEPVAVGTGDDLANTVDYVGHREHMEMCLSAFRRLSIKGEGQILLIVGSLGSGKTRFVHEIIRRQAQQGPERAAVHSIMTVVDPINQFVPFAGIYEVLLHMMKRLRLVEEFEDRNTGVRTVHLRTRNTRLHDPSTLKNIRILSSVFPQLHPEVNPVGNSNSGSEDIPPSYDGSDEDPVDKDAPESSSVSAASASASVSSDAEKTHKLFDQTRTLIFEIVHEYIQYRKKPVVLTFDDGQWLDAWSWSMIAQFRSKIVDEKWPLIVIATSRAAATTMSVFRSERASETAAESAGSFDSDEPVQTRTVSASSSPHKGSLQSLAVLNSASLSQAAASRRNSVNSNSSWSSRIASMKMLHSGSIGKSLSDVTSLSDGDGYSLSPEKKGLAHTTPAVAHAPGNLSVNRKSSSSLDDTTQSEGNDTSTVSTYIKRLVSHKNGVLQITLKPLGADDCGRLMAGVIGGTPPTRIVQHVMARTKGNPLYTIETTSALLASKFLILFHGECQITEELDDHDLGKGLPLPDTLQGILRSNIDRLKSSTQEILQLVSVACSNQSPAELDLLYEMFTREQMWNSASSSSAGPPSINISKVRDHVKREVQNLVKSRRLIYMKRSHVKKSYASTKKRLRFALKELQETTYKISPFSVRQRLHLSAAVYYERELVETLGSSHGLAACMKGPETTDPVTFYTTNEHEDARNAILQSLSEDSRSISLCTDLELIAWHFEAAGKHVTAAGYVACALFSYARQYEYTKEVQLLRQMIRLCSLDDACGQFVSSFVTNPAVCFSQKERTRSRLPALAVLQAHLAKCLLQLGAFSEAEASLMVALEGMDHRVNLNKTRIQVSSETRRGKHSGHLSMTSLLTTRRSRLSVFKRESSELQNQRHRLENHVSSFQGLISANQKTILAADLAVTSNMTEQQARNLECASALLSMAKVQHELNHPFRGLVVLYDCLVLLISMNLSLPLLAEALGVFASLASCVLQNEKLGALAMSLAGRVAVRVASRQTIALVQLQQSVMSLSRSDFDMALKAANVASNIYGDKTLGNARAQEMVSLHLGDVYIFQSRLWPALSKYATVLDSAQLRSDWRRQLSALVGQAFVHFVARNWDDASDAVGMCESLVTDIVAALDSATVITVRSFILLAELSQYKVDLSVLYSTTDIILGDSHGEKPVGVADDEGASRFAHRPFQYNHRSLFAYYAIIMTCVTVLESYRLDAQHLTSSKKFYSMRKKSWFGNHNRHKSLKTGSSEQNMDVNSLGSGPNAHRHLAYGLGFGLPRLGQGIARGILTNQEEFKFLENRTYMVLKSMKQFVAQSYPVGMSMFSSYNPRIKNTRKKHSRFRYKYLSGLFHWSSGRESHARTKWKQGANQEKNKLPLFEALCRHELCRTASMNSSANAHAADLDSRTARLKACAEAFNRMGYPRLHDAVEAELLSYHEAQDSLQADVDETFSDGKKMLGRHEGERSTSNHMAVEERARGRRRRKSVLREADFTRENPLSKKLQDK